MTFDAAAGIVMAIASTRIALAFMEPIVGSMTCKRDACATRCDSATMPNDFDARIANLCPV
jgi:hypothetical protein